MGDRTSSGAEALVHEKLRSAVVDGAAVLDSVYSLMQARAQLELSYSKSLQRLSQHTFSFNGMPLPRNDRIIMLASSMHLSTEKTIHPAVFEAIASLRGDIANEGVQHAELAKSIQSDVIDPLSRLNERNDKVQKIVRCVSVINLSC